MTTCYVIDKGAELLSLKIKTRNPSIQVVLDVDWEIQKRKNLIANGVRIKTTTQLDGYGNNLSPIKYY